MKSGTFIRRTISVMRSRDGVFTMGLWSLMFNGLLQFTVKPSIVAFRLKSRLSQTLWTRALRDLSTTLPLHLFHCPEREKNGHCALLPASD